MNSLPIVISPSKIKDTKGIWKYPLIAATALFVCWMITKSPSFHIADMTFSILSFITTLNPILASSFLIFANSLIIVLCLPSSPLNLASGLILGPIVGSIVAIASVNLGALFAFLLSRRFFSRSVLNRIQKSSSFKNYYTAFSDPSVSEIFLLRFSPAFPFPILNWLFGVTHVSVSRYATATLLGTIPFTTMFAITGSKLSNIHDAIESGKGLKTNIYGLVAIITITVVASVVTTINVKKRLNRNIL